MKLPVYNLQNQPVGEIEVSDEVFDGPVREHLHQEVVVAQLAARRRGTAATKGRSQVAGSKRKMWRQKGTGRARHSTRKVNLFVGGGRAFAKRPKDESKKLNKRVRRAALVSVLSQKVQNGQLKVVEHLQLDSIKTKKALGILEALETPRALVVDAPNRNLKLSVRNLTDYKYLASQGLNVYDALRFDHLVVTRQALETIQGALLR
jgi:large subunit ribosomal protein L4